MMNLNVKEVRMLRSLVRKSLDDGRSTLATFDEDSDAYMELANDLMVLDTLISRLDDEERMLSQQRMSLT